MRYIKVYGCEDCPYNDLVDYGFGGLEENRCLLSGSEIHKTLLCKDGILPNCPLDTAVKIINDLK